MSRGLKANGRLGPSDLTCQGPLPPALETLIACIADAQPLDTYGRYLETAGLTVTQVEAHDQALADLVQTVRGNWQQSCW